MSLIIPKDYDPKLSIRETEEAIRYIRETFQDEFGKEMAYKECQRQCLLKKALV